MPPEGPWTVGDADDPYSKDHGPVDPLQQLTMLIGVSPSNSSPDQKSFHPQIGPNGLLQGNKSDLDTLNNQFHDSRLPQTATHIDLAHVLRFMDGYNGIIGANDEVARGVDDWNAAADELNNAVAALNVLSANRFGLKGHAVNMIIDKVNLLKDSITPTAVAARRMTLISKMFANDVGQTKAWFNTAGLKDMAQNGSQDQKAWADQAAQMTVRYAYNPPIETISSNHPNIPSAPPQIDGNPAGVPTPMASIPGGPGSGTPGGLNTSGLGAPAEGKDPTSNQDPNQNPSQNQGFDPSSASDAANGAAQGAGEAASKAAEGAGSAAKDALKSLLDGKNPADPANANPFLASPVGLNSANLASALGKSGGGAGGGSNIPRIGAGTAPALPTIKLADQAVTSAKASPDTSASRASVSSGSGSGSGAPHAGHGSSAAGKEHKANKALRHNKHGVIDEDSAVVPVIGDDPQAPPVPPRAT